MVSLQEIQTVLKDGTQRWDWVDTLIVLCGAMGGLGIGAAIFWVAGLL